MNHRQERRIIANDLDSLAVRLSALSDDPWIASAVRKLEEARDLVDKNADRRPRRRREED